MFAYLKFFVTIFIVTVIGLVISANNFTRLTGIVIEKPIDVYLHKGDIYVSVMSVKKKYSGEEIAATINYYRKQLPENHYLLEEAKRWYNMTRTYMETR